MNNVELLKVVPNLTDETYPLAETLWSSYNSEYCHNYRSLEKELDLDREKIKSLLTPNNN